jgi:hypothetical protein
VDCVIFKWIFYGSPKYANKNRASEQEWEEEHDEVNKKREKGRDELFFCKKIYDQKGFTGKINFFIGYLLTPLARSLSPQRMIYRRQL